MNPPLNNPPVQFVSVQLPGATMNRYGVVFYAGRIAEPITRGAVQKEALAAGWKLVPSGDRDLGLVWQQP